MVSNRHSDRVPTLGQGVKAVAAPQLLKGAEEERVLVCNLFPQSEHDLSGQ